MVFGLRNSRAATSRFVKPVATSRATVVSCGVRSSIVDGSRRRARWPVARSAVRVSSAQPSAPSSSKLSSAECSLTRASARRLRRRSSSPYRSWVRARS